MSCNSWEVKFRSVKEDDLGVIQSLYKECFPVTYPASWFQDLLTNKNLITIVAVVDDNVIGILVGKLLCLKDCNVEDQNILASSFSVLTHVAYLLSLGVAEGYRTRGVASMLLKAFVTYVSGNVCTVETLLCLPSSQYSDVNANQQSENAVTKKCVEGVADLHSLLKVLEELDPIHSVYAVYLHVLRSNLTARRFYEKRGFVCHSIRYGCYSIDGQPADGCTYVLHLNNGYSDANTVFSWIRKCINYWNSTSISTNVSHLYEFANHARTMLFERFYEFVQYFRPRRLDV